MQPAAPGSPFFRAEGPHVPDDGGVEFGAGMTFEYAKAPLRAAGIDAEGGEDFRSAVVKHALLLHVGGSLTPVHWLTFDLAVPFAFFQTGDPTLSRKGYATVDAAAGQGVGDPRIGLHFRPIDRKTFGLFLGARFWAPIGSRSAYLSDGRFRVEASLGAAGETGPVLYGCTFGVAPLFFGQRDGDRIAGACALHVRPAPVVSFGVEPTAAVFVDELAPDEHTHRLLIEPLGALRLWLGRFRVGLAAGPGFGGAAGTAEVRALLGVAYVGGGRPPKPAPAAPRDGDLDGIPDAADACPSEAGPENADASKRGCPVLDRDADGVLDADDYCPDRAGIGHADAKANGCPDSDNDGLPDPIDACRNEPGGAPEGCPKYARLTREGFKVTPPVQFSEREAKLGPAERAALEEVAATMRANPTIEQVSIQLGTKGARPELSDQRAQAILLVLRAGNLDSSRYEVVLRDDLKAGTVLFRLVK